MKDSISPRASHLHAGDGQGRRLAAVREIPPHCATCEHYVTDPAVLQTGDCRLFYPAPVGYPAHAGEALSVGYPQVAATDYCSAHPDAASLG